MAFQNYRIASGWDVALGSLDNVEDILPTYHNKPAIISGRATYDPGNIGVRADGLVAVTGFDFIVWNFGVLSVTQWNYLQANYTTGGNTYAGKVTIYTPVEDEAYSPGGLDNFVRLNTYLYLPKLSELTRRAASEALLNVPIRHRIEAVSS